MVWVDQSLLSTYRSWQVDGFQSWAITNNAVVVTMYKSLHEHMLPFVLGKGLGVGWRSYIVYMFNF